MLEELKIQLPESWILPCEHGRWLHCRSLNRAVLFNHDNKPIRMCGRDGEKFFSMDIEVVSNNPLTNLVRLITLPSPYKLNQDDTP